MLQRTYYSTSKNEIKPQLDIQYCSRGYDYFTSKNEIKLQFYEIYLHHTARNIGAHCP